MGGGRSVNALKDIFQENRFRRSQTEKTVTEKKEEKHLKAVLSRCSLNPSEKQILLLI